jgi:hypothetical protein
MKILINIITTITALGFFTTLIPVNVKYKQAFADKTISLTENVSLLDYLTLGTKEGFIKYEK